MSYRYKLRFDILVDSAKDLDRLENLLVESLINYLPEKESNIGDQRLTIIEGKFNHV